MSMRRRMRRRGRRLSAAICLALVVSTGCQRIGNVERIRFGHEFTADGERLRVAALQPRCGCVSLVNTSSEPVWLESWFYEIPRGSVIVQPGERRRVLFDWGGPETTDYYELVAFRVAQPNGQPIRDDGPTGGLRLQDVMAEYSPTLLVSCQERSCEFGTLAMNRAIEETTAQEQHVAVRQRGVNVSSIIEAAAPLNRCGCMLLRNTSAVSAVTLRATRHGAVVGQFELPPDATVPMPFDWGGPLETDRYVIDAVAVRGAQGLGAPPLTPQVGTDLQGTPPGQPGQPPAGVGEPASGEPQVSAPAMAIRLRDYISVVGQIEDMDCTPEYAVFRPHIESRDEAAGAPSTPISPATAASTEMGLTNVIQCQWLPGGAPGLGMSLAYDPNRSVVRPPAAAAAAPDSAPDLAPEAGAAASTPAP